MTTYNGTDLTPGMQLLASLAASPLPCPDAAMTVVEEQLAREHEQLEQAITLIGDWTNVRSQQANTVALLMEALDLFTDQDDADLMSRVRAWLEGWGVNIQAPAPATPEAPDVWLGEMAGQLSQFAVVHQQNGIETSDSGGVCVFAHGEVAEHIQSLLLRFQRIDWDYHNDTFTKSPPPPTWPLWAWTRSRSDG